MGVSLVNWWCPEALSGLLCKLAVSPFFLPKKQKNTYLLEKSNLSLGDFESGGGVSVKNTEWNIVE